MSNVLCDVAAQLLALALCFAPVWLLLNANRVAAYRRAAGKRLWRMYATTLARWVPGPLRTWIYAYHGRLLCNRLSRQSPRQ